MMAAMDPIDAARIADDVFAKAPELAAVPGIAYGLVHGDLLVHAGGRGAATLGGPVPGPDTVFRIASMTKSFTACAVLALRDAGLLRLDDPVTAHLPFVAGIGAPDGPPLTVRDLLTMGSGLATDDPWGDRQESLAVDEFDALVAGVDGVASGSAAVAEFAARRMDDGYEPGVHDADAAAIMMALLPWWSAATLRESGVVRGVAGAWVSALPAKDRAALQRELTALASLGEGRARSALRDRVRPALDALAAAAGLRVEFDGGSAVEWLVATGGTMIAGWHLLRKLGAEVVEGAAIVDLPELGGSRRIAELGLPLHTLLEFDGE